MQVTVDLPESLLRRYDSGTDISRLIREALMVDAYLAGELSRAQIGELLGMNFHQVEDWFAKKGIHRDYGLNDLDDDRVTLDKLLPIR